VSADGVGSFAQHGVVEEPVAGLGVVAAPEEARVVGVVGWDRPEVFFPVEPGETVLGGLVESDPDEAGAEVVGEAVFAAEAPAVAAGSAASPTPPAPGVPTSPGAGAAVTTEMELTTRFVGDLAEDFFVASYQRGYRWGEHEVEQLLDDLRGSIGSTYFLQLVVVSRRADGSWELIDGQQRLTMLYLLFRYLQREHLPNTGPNYSITYDTRAGSQD
jgi:hypothetical protein